MIILLIILLSMALGSFLNSVISYYVAECNYQIYRSYCFCGKEKIKIKHLFPIISYLLLKGKCHCCSEKIPVRYLIVEILTTIIGLLTYLRFGLSIETVYYFFILLVLLCIAIIDFYKLIIPNIFIFLLFILFFLKIEFINNEITVSLITALLITISLYFVSYLVKIKKGKESIGMGDIKLIFVLSLLFNFPLNFAGLWLASIFALSFYILNNIFKRNYLGDKIPFGPFISGSFMIIIYFQNNLISLTNSITGI